jgi:hypothetical protein
MTGLLIGKKRISEYLDGASDHLLKKWIERGMPVLIEDGRWTAHSENLEDFFKAYTRKRAKASDID